MIKIYIASPYTNGNQIENVKKQVDAANALFKYGLNVFVPLLFHFQHFVHPLKYQEWLNVDLDWLLSCDAVLRLNGESEGADLEVMKAKANKIPVFYSIKDVIRWYEINSSNNG